MAAHPGRDLQVPFAGVARATGGHHVIERVATAPGDRLDAVALERGLERAAVRAAGPRVQQGGPLLGAQVVVDAYERARAWAAENNISLDDE